MVVFSYFRNLISAACFYTALGQFQSTCSWEQKGQTVTNNQAGFMGLSLDCWANGTVFATGAYIANRNESEIGFGPGFEGSVNIYEYNSTSDLWEQLGHGIFGDAPFQFFGRPIALASHAFRVAIAASSTAMPDVKVYEYEREVGEWLQKGSNLVTGESDGTTGVAISGDGLIVAVGRPNGTASPGFVRVFEYDEISNDWSPMGDDILGEKAGDRSGFDLAMSESGEIVAIASPQNDFV